jgi:microcin C transport system substrate-binding protein
MIRFGLACLFAAFSLPAWAGYAYSLWGDIKYPADFKHVAYVNPNAPKGGEITLVPNSRATNFDKYNPFTLKGDHPPGLHNEGKNSSLIFETLMGGTSDEPATGYGLLAEDIAVAQDRLSVVFKLNPKAKFSNGDPVLAKDVKHSFDMITSKLASPRQRVLLEDLKSCAVIDERTVRFDFKTNDKQMPFVAGSLMVFSHKWGGGKPFDQIITEPPIASGPYKIGKVDFGKTITYERRKDYWGWDLPLRKGTYNFDRVTYKLYTDDTVRQEAFKAGEFDMIEENIARRWARSYTGPKFTSGELSKKEFLNPFPGAYQGYAMNTRRALFKDVRVRKALTLALDYEWMNRQLFYNAYTRIPSHFSATEFTAAGTPGADELEFLEPLRSLLKPEVFGQVAQPGSTAEPGSLRANLLQARELLKQAGWNYKDGALRDAQGKPFVFEMLFDQPSSQRVIIPYQRNLEKLGIKMNMRIVDFALAKKRLDIYDFDMTSIAVGSGSIPGSSMKDMYGSASAKREGNLNYWGLEDPAIDRLLEHIERAPSYAQLRGAARAFDRVMAHGYYAVPAWYSPVYRLAFKAREFERPAEPPKYYGIQNWALSTWWASPAHLAKTARTSKAKD